MFVCLKNGFDCGVACDKLKSVTGNKMDLFFIKASVLVVRLLVHACMQAVLIVVLVILFVVCNFSKVAAYG